MDKRKTLITTPKPSKSKATPKPPKSKNVSTEVIPPRIMDNGKCISCKSSNVVEESINCHVCDNLFHAYCRDKRGLYSNESICTKTFLDSFAPVKAKYGVNAQRWGNFCFICDVCDDFLKRNPKSSKGGKSMETPTQTDVTGHVEGGSINNVVSDQCIQKIVSPDSTNILGRMETLFSGMKEDILSNVNQLINDKLGVVQQAECLTDSSKPPNVSSPLAANQLYSDVLAVTNAPQITAHRNVQPSVEAPGQYKSSGLSEHVLVLTSEADDINYSTVEKSITDTLVNMPINFLTIKENTGKIIIGFPTFSYKETGKSMLSLSQVVQDLGFSINEPKKMLPKVTITNIPNYLVSHIHRSESLEEYRKKLKDCLYNLIMSKNAYILDLVSNHENTFEIVYVNVGKSYTTLGIKVSSTLYDDLIATSKLFIGNTCCNVSDRFDIRQCFKCQKMGHISTKCQETSPICMYCSSSHGTKSCPNKHNVSLHRCRNCAQSRSPSVIAGCNTHHSGSDKCPIVIREKMRMQRNTNYSKN